MLGIQQRRGGVPLPPRTMACRCRVQCRRSTRRDAAHDDRQPQPSSNRVGYAAPMAGRQSTELARFARRSSAQHFRLCCTPSVTTLKGCWGESQRLEAIPLSVRGIRRVAKCQSTTDIV